MIKIARFTLREVVRKRLLLALVLLTAIYLGFFFYGVWLQEQAFARRAQASGGDPRTVERLQFAWVFVVVMGLYVVNFLSSLVSVLSTVGTVSGELESGTMLTIATKPLQRSRIVLGKWLGYGLLAVGYVVLTSAILMLGTRWLVGYVPPEPVPAMALMALSALLLVTLTLLGSTLFPTLTNGVVLVMFYGMSWTGGILGVIGSITNTKVLIRLSEVFSWVIPTDALWRFASYYLQTEEFRKLQAEGIRANPFTGLEAPTPLFLLWTGFYLLATLALAIWIFQKRDL